MNTKTGVLLVLCFMLGPSYAQDRLQPERLEKLTRAINGKDIEIKCRAIEELGQAVKDNKIAQKVLIEYLFNDTYFATDVIVVGALSRSDSSVVKQIIKKCDDSNSVHRHRNLEKAIFVFGRMGTKAKGSIPFLLEQLDKYKEDPEMEGYIRVVLANVGYKSGENLKTIDVDIRNKTTRGKAEVVQMSRCGAGEWVTDEVIQGLVNWIDVKDVNEKMYAKSDIYLYGSLALASIGPKAQVAQSIMKKHLRYADMFCESCTLPIMYEIALTKIAPQKADAEESLKKVMRCMDHRYNERWDHTTGLAVDESCYLFDVNVMKFAGKCLEDDHDPILLCGALRILGWIGLDAKKYVPNVITILKKNSDEECRRIAAKSLGGMADPCDIQQLESAFQKEQSYGVKAEITESIRILRLEERKY